MIRSNDYVARRNAPSRSCSRRYTACANGRKRIHPPFLPPVEKILCLFAYSYMVKCTQPEVEKDILETLSRYVREGRSTPGAPQENCPNPFWPGLDFMK